MGLLLDVCYNISKEKWSIAHLSQEIFRVELFKNQVIIYQTNNPQSLHEYKKFQSINRAL